VESAKCFGRISDFLFTVSDEAIVLLSIENCSDAVQEEIQENDEDEKSAKCTHKESTQSKGKI
jgi:hypothetical protein